MPLTEVLTSRSYLTLLLVRVKLQLRASFLLQRNRLSPYVKQLWLLFLLATHINKLLQTLMVIL